MAGELRAQYLAAGLSCDSLSSQSKAGWCAARCHGLPLLLPTWSVDLRGPGHTERGGRKQCFSLSRDPEGPKASGLAVSDPMHSSFKAEEAHP